MMAVDSSLTRTMQAMSGRGAWLTTGAVWLALAVAVPLALVAGIWNDAQGQLAGAWYSVDAIPAGWREKVTMGDEIVVLADRLLAERPA